MIYIILSIPVLIYISFWLYFIVGSFKKTFRTFNHKEKELSISILIPFRNENHRIGPLLSCLEELDDTGCELNIFFIDDNSTDKGKEQINSWKNNTKKRVQLIELNQPNEFGKKRAIKKGVDQSSDDWIFTIDADSTISSNFLQQFKKEIVKNKNIYLLPVVEEPSGFLLSVVESYMLSIIAFASANNNQPMLANGTGMIFKRKLFLQLAPYDGNYHIASGDDLFLLEKAMEEVPFKIQPIRNRELIVHTDSPISYKSMLSRSVRWVGKMSQSNLHYTKAIGLVVIICNLSVLLTFIIQAFEHKFNIAITILAFKFFFDLLLFIIAVNFYGNRKLIIKTPIVFLLYPLHLIIVMINLMIGIKTWKGRKI